MVSRPEIPKSKGIVLRVFDKCARAYFCDTARAFSALEHRTYSDIHCGNSCASVDLLVWGRWQEWAMRIGLLVRTFLDALYLVTAVIF
jgi:hypothetical protein